MRFEFKDDKYIHRIKVSTYNFMEDGISMIYEKRRLDGRIIEVWHLILSNEGKFVHKHRKYPLDQFQFFKELSIGINQVHSAVWLLPRIRQ